MLHLINQQEIFKTLSTKKPHPPRSKRQPIPRVTNLKRPQMEHTYAIKLYILYKNRSGIYNVPNTDTETDTIYQIYSRIYV